MSVHSSCMAGSRFLVGEPLHQVDGLPRADSRPGTAVDGGGGEHVVAVDDQRPVHFADVGQRAHRDHPAGAVADLQPPDLVDAVAEGAVGLGDHLPRAAEKVEVVDVERAEEHLQRVEGVGQRHVRPTCTACGSCSRKAAARSRGTRSAAWSHRACRRRAGSSAPWPCRRGDPPAAGEWKSRGRRRSSTMALNPPVRPAPRIGTGSNTLTRRREPRRRTASATWWRSPSP